MDELGAFFQHVLSQENQDSGPAGPLKIWHKVQIGQGFRATAALLPTLNHVANICSNLCTENYATIPRSIIANDTTFQAGRIRAQPNGPTRDVYAIHWTFLDTSLLRPGTGRHPWRSFAVQLVFSKTKLDFDRCFRDLVDVHPQLRGVAFFLSDDAPEYSSDIVGVHFPFAEQLGCWKHKKDNLRSKLEAMGLPTMVNSISELIFGKPVELRNQGLIYEGGLVCLPVDEMPQLQTRVHELFRPIFTAANADNVKFEDFCR